MSTAEMPAVRMKRPIVAFGQFTFDPDNQLLRRNGVELAPPPRVLGVLQLLLDRAGNLVPRQELIERVWQGAFVTDTSLAEAVSVLRQTLGDDPQSPTYVQTVHRRGYRFVAPVTEIPLEAPHAPRSGFAADAAVDAPASTVVPSIGGQLVPWSAAAICAILATVAVWQATHRPESRPAAARFAVQLPANLRFDARRPAVALSPDGTRAAWSACDAVECRLYVRPLEQLEASPLPGTEDASSPFFSPDGNWIGFFANGKLKKVALSGGAPVTLADVTLPRGGVWASDGRIIYGSSTASGLSQVSDAGGTPEPLTVPKQAEGEIRHAWPALTPDGGTLLFTVAESLQNDAPGRLAIAALQGRERVAGWSTVLDGVGLARAIGSDLLVVARSAELQIVAIDTARRTVAGVPETLLTGLARADGLAQFAVSPAGTLVFLRGDAAAPGTAGRSLTWWSPSGTTRTAIGLEEAGNLALSADGQRVAWTDQPGASRSDLWSGDLLRGAATRLTHDGRNASPVWSPDGRRIFFSRTDGGLLRLASIASEGGPIAMLPARSRHAFPAAVSADGRTLAFVELNAGTHADIWVAPAAGGAPRPVVESPFDDLAPALSRDGGLLAYQSDEGGRWDVYVQRLRDGKRSIVSTAGGERPFWSQDGTALFYQAGTRLLRATVDADLAIGTAAEVLLLGDSIAVGQAPDGRLLLDSHLLAPATSAVIALHWDREARAAAGPRATVTK